MKKFLIAGSIAALVAVGLFLVVKDKNSDDIVEEMHFSGNAEEQIMEMNFSENDEKDENSLHYIVQLKDNKFVPEIVEVPAGKDFQLIVHNLDETLEEFESLDLKKEKLVKGGKKITLNVAALEPGEYKFFGEFHPRTAQGKLIAK